MDFDLSRIASAIQKAFEATKMPYDKDIIRMLTLQVTADVAPKVTNDRINVEEIQDSVEAVLQRSGYASVAKAYILYRKAAGNSLDGTRLQKTCGRLSEGRRLAR